MGFPGRMVDLNEEGMLLDSGETCRHLWLLATLMWCACERWKKSTRMWDRVPVCRVHIPTSAHVGCIDIFFIADICQCFYVGPIKELNSVTVVTHSSWIIDFLSRLVLVRFKCMPEPIPAVNGAGGGVHSGHHAWLIKNIHLLFESYII